MIEILRKFHELWGMAKSGATYDKKKWIDLQALIDSEVLKKSPSRRVEVMERRSPCKHYPRTEFCCLQRGKLPWMWCESCTDFMQALVGNLPESFFSPAERVLSFEP